MGLPQSLTTGAFKNVMYLSNYFYQVAFHLTYCIKLAIVNFSWHIEFVCTLNKAHFSLDHRASRVYPCRSLRLKSKQGIVVFVTSAKLS